MAEASERLLFEHLGENALSYVLAVDKENLRLRFEDAASHRLNEVQESLLAQMVMLDEQMSGWQEGRSTTGEWTSRLTNRPDDGREISLGNLIRLTAGGSIAAIPEGLQPVESILLHIALECYPGMLVKESDDPFDRRIGLPISLFRNPLNSAFQELVLADSDLKRLMTTESESSGKGGSTLRSTGQGGSHQLWTLAETIVKSGWTLALLDSTQPTPESFIDGVLRSIATIRLAIRGKEANIPARIGLTGVLLPENTNEIELGWAKVRRADERDTHFIKQTSLEGQLTTTTQQGETVVINYSGDLVVELNIPYAIQIGELDIQTPWPEEMKTGYQAIENAVENLRLGLLLAFPDQRVVLHTSWQVMIDPMSQHHGAGWADLQRAVGLMPTQLSATRVDTWKNWSSKIAKHRTPPIGVAIRRMLAAVAERRTSEDVLVDAVIVWENLFGARTETTLRVTSSLAWLLGDSADDRKQRQKDYKKLYSLRSDVVHGAAVVNQQNLQTGSMEAVDISINALRAVFGERPSLLEIKSSEDRSLEMLHSGPQPKVPASTTDGVELDAVTTADKSDD